MRECQLFRDCRRPATYIVTDSVRGSLALCKACSYTWCMEHPQPLGQQPESARSHVANALQVLELVIPKHSSYTPDSMLIEIAILARIRERLQLALKELKSL